MTNFFKHAPPQDSLQKRFLEAVGKRQDMVAALPLGYPTPGLYSFTGMLGHGLAIVIGSNPEILQRHMRHFRQSGYTYPDIAVLDGTQMPHEERDVYGQINHNRVRILFMLPELFSRLSFLEVLLHNTIKFVLIEEAEKLLPGFSRDSRYNQLKEAFAQLNQRPPLVMVSMPLPPSGQDALADTLGLASPVFLHEPLDLQTPRLTVDLRVTEYQKYLRLIKLLSGADKGKVGQLSHTGPVIINAAFPDAADRLTASLMDYGFDSVWAYHYRKTPKQRTMAETRFMGEDNVIVVSASEDTRYWLPYSAHQQRMLTLVDWHLPVSVERHFASVFRMQEPATVAVKSHLFYTKEDYQAALMRAHQGQWVSNEHRLARLESLHRVRRWILSAGCRKQTLIAYYLGQKQIAVPPCGTCDRCLHQTEGLMKRLLRHWLY